MAKYIVGLSATTLGVFCGALGLAVFACCLTAIICAHAPSTRSAPRVLPSRPIVHQPDSPLGSMEAIKEAKLNNEYGPVDKSKLHEKKEGFFSRMRARKAARSQCSQCTSRLAFSAPSWAAPVYSLPVSPTYPIQPAIEPMPQIDPNSFVDGSYALQQSPLDWFAPVMPEVSQPACVNCRKQPSYW